MYIVKSLYELEYFPGKSAGAAVGIEGVPVNLELSVCFSGCNSFYLLFFAVCNEQF